MIESVELRRQAGWHDQLGISSSGSPGLRGTCPFIPQILFQVLKIAVRKENRLRKRKKQALPL